MPAGSLTWLIIFIRNQAAGSKENFNSNLRFIVKMPTLHLYKARDCCTNQTLWGGDEPS